MSFQGKIAVVTGAVSGAGSAMARTLLEGGASTVGLLDRDAIRLEELADTLAVEFGESRIVALPTDLADLTQVRHSVREFVRLSGRIDIVADHSAEGIDRTMRALVDRGISRQTTGPWRAVLTGACGGSGQNVRQAVREVLVCNLNYDRLCPVTVSSTSALAALASGRAKAA